MSSSRGNHGLPFVQLENAEVVRLRIAKEHLDSLFAMKKEHLNEVLTSLSKLTTSIETAESAKVHVYSWSGEDEPDSIELDAKYNRLFKYAENMSVFGSDVREEFKPIRAAQFFPVDPDDNDPGKRGERRRIYNGKPTCSYALSRRHRASRLELLVSIGTKIVLWKKQQMNALEEELKAFLK